MKWFTPGDTTRTALHEGATFRVQSDSLGSKLYLAILGRGLAEAWVHSYPAGLSEVIPLLDGHPIGGGLTFTRTSPMAERHLLSVRLEDESGSPLALSHFRISWSSNLPDDVQIVGGTTPDPTLSINADDVTATITLTVNGHRKALPVTVTRRADG